MTTTANNQQNNNNNDVEKPVCRICHGTDKDASQLCGYDKNWVQPCKCSGTLKWVHRGCFRKWHDQAFYEQRIRCSLCSHVFRFSLRLRPRWYTKLPIGIWLQVLLHLLTMLWLLFYIATFDFLISIFRYAILLGLFVKMTRLAMRLWESAKLHYDVEMLLLENYKLQMEIRALERELAELAGDDDEGQEHEEAGIAAPTNSSVFERSIQNVV